MESDVFVLSKCHVSDETNPKAKTPLPEHFAGATDTGEEDVEIDIITPGNGIGTAAGDTVDSQLTGSLSSFGNTVSDAEGWTEPSENEADSSCFGNGVSVPSQTSFSSLFCTRKKPTHHWRSFVQPLLWRCKWLELKLYEINSHVQKYGAELAACEREKHSAKSLSIISDTEDYNSKLLPFTNPTYRRKAVKRRKRKKIEDSVDIKEYISHHAVFSYPENKRHNADSTSMLDNHVHMFSDQQIASNEDASVDDNEFSLELWNDDDSDEYIFYKIEALQSHIQRLKRRLELLIPKAAKRYGPPQPDSALGLPLFRTSAENGAVDTSVHASECDIGDLILSESATWGHGEESCVPGVYESTIGLLSPGDAMLHKQQDEDPCEDIVDNILKPEVVEADEHNQEKRCDVPRNDQETPSVPLPNMVIDPGEDRVDGSFPKLCLALDLQFFGKKRSKRNTCSDGWSKKSADWLDLLAPMETCDPATKVRRKLKRRSVKDS